MQAWRRSAALLTSSVSAASKRANSQAQQLQIRHRRQRSRGAAVASAAPARAFSSSGGLHAVRPFLLADIGEGIREVQIIQWFVQPGARVEQFDKLCEVQSDKASVEITSRFDGVIKKLHYDADDMAIVGKPLVDIDIQSEISPADEALTGPPPDAPSSPSSQSQSSSSSSDGANKEPSPTPSSSSRSAESSSSAESSPSQNQSPSSTTSKTSSSSSDSSSPSFSSSSSSSASDSRPKSKNDTATLATPAVRHLTKQHNIDISAINGTGKDGRVLKEDVYNHVQRGGAASSSASPQSGGGVDASAIGSEGAAQGQAAAATAEDQTVALTPTQAGMFKTMSKSLHIPHFMYSDSIQMDNLLSLRAKINEASTASPAPSQNDNISKSSAKLSALSFIIKAVSLALNEYPVLNARLDTSEASKPRLVYRGQHNIGIAVDTPAGLLVPVIKGVQALSIAAIGAEIARLGALGRAGRLSSADLAGGTFTVSNIGSVGGGGVVSPVIVDGQLAIVAVGNTKPVPAFDAAGSIVRQHLCTFSWAADHRVVDGATAARCALAVKRFLEHPGTMLTNLR